MSGLTAKIDTMAEKLRDRLPSWNRPSAVIQFAAEFDWSGLLDKELATVPFCRLSEFSFSHSSETDSFKIVLGECGDSQLLVISGGYDLHHGYGLDVCLLPVCAAVSAGISDVILTGTALGIEPEWKPDTWVLVTDYINDLGASPLAGNPNLGDRLTLDMSKTFSQSLNSELINSQPDARLIPRLGVYQASPGPQFSSPAETARARRNEVDILGTGILPEAIAAHAMGARVAALALLTQQAATHWGDTVTLAKSLESVDFCSQNMIEWLRKFLLNRG